MIEERKDSENEELEGIGDGNRKSWEKAEIQREEILRMLSDWRY